MHQWMRECHTGHIPVTLDRLRRITPGGFSMFAVEGAIECVYCCLIRPGGKKEFAHSLTDNQLQWAGFAIAQGTAVAFLCASEIALERLRVVTHRRGINGEAIHDYLDTMFLVCDHTTKL